MNYQWIGAVLILGGCSSCGISIASRYRRDERMLTQLLRALHYMQSELQYRLSPLPELCRSAAGEVEGVLREVFLRLAVELEQQTAPDAGSCMKEAIRKSGELSYRVRKQLFQLGNSLGRFDLTGQLRGLRCVEASCRESLQMLRKNQDSRLRSYQTLGICAGAALVILFL